MANTSPLCSAARFISSAGAREEAEGLSHSTCLPWANACITSSGWRLWGVTTNTASNSCSWSYSSSTLEHTRTVAGRVSFAHCCPSAWRQTTAARVRGNALPSAIIWAYLRPMVPVPMIAVFTVCMVFLLFSVLYSLQLWRTASMASRSSPSPMTMSTSCP